MKKIFSLVVVSVMIITCAFCLTACNKKADNTEFYDKITQTCRLTKDYAGKSFLTDGIGLAKVTGYTDGDTTRFQLTHTDSKNETVIIRYYSIDTPESTGSVEKWGKAASNFVKNQLLNAEEDIVLEATSIPAKHDSYGERYLGYVWYKPKGSSQYKNLNLEIVENGFSENKGQDTSDFPYNDYFKKAEKFARSIELRLYSKLADPLYSTEPVVMTLKDIIEDLKKGDDSTLYNAETEAGAKVQFDACLTELTFNKTYTFTATDYDRETGESYSIDIYAAYQSSNESKMKVGHLYTIIGNVDVHNGTFQIKGLVYSSRYTLPGYTKVIQRNYYYIFDSDRSYLDNYSQALYSNATVTSSKVENGVLTIEATAQQRTNNGVNEQVSKFTFKVNVPNDYENEFTAGARFSVSGYQFTENSGIIEITDYNNITLKSN